MYDEWFADTLIGYEELDPTQVSRLKSIYRNSGWQGVARYELATSLSEYRSGLHPSREAHIIARSYAQLGRSDEAFRWLEVAVQEFDGSLPYLTVDPRFDGIRSDPRFGGVIRRLGIPDR
jgi:hypothetical protein